MSTVTSIVGVVDAKHRNVVVFSSFLAREEDRRGEERKAEEMTGEERGEKRGERGEERGQRGEGEKREERKEKRGDRTEETGQRREGRGERREERGEDGGVGGEAGGGEDGEWGEKSMEEGIEERMNKRGRGDGGEMEEMLSEREESIEDRMRG